MIETEDGFSRRLVTFARDLTRYAESGRESDARRALVSPYTGLANADARALCVVAGERRSILDTIAAERVVVSHESLLAARHFARGIGTIREAYRAQGATASEHVATLAITFGFPASLDRAEGRTFAVIEQAAREIDATQPLGKAWDARSLIIALEALAAAHPQRRTPVDETGALPERVAEPRDIVKRRHGHYSASSLGTFAECERRWFYRYVCASIEDAGSPASFYGTAFHWALERFHQEYPHANDVATDLLERKLDAYLATAFDRYRIGFPTNVEWELARRRAKRTGRRYLAWFLDRAKRSPFTVIGTESTVELELDGYRFIGYVDRIDRDDATGDVTIIDYKTGSIAESADQYRENVRDFVDFQLPFYYWARTAAGDRVTRLALVPLKDPSRDVAPIEIEIVPVSRERTYDRSTVGTIGLDELERARVKMGEIAATLSDGPIEFFPATTDSDACTYCSYATACRSKPLPCEDRFGR